MRRSRLPASALACLLALSAMVMAGGTPAAGAAVRHLLLASTTSTDNSGLLRHLLPRFTRDSGIAVRAVVAGTGQVLRLGRNGDADVLLVHHPPSERRFVAQGHGIDRRVVMRNDFVIVGPADDPAAIAAAGGLGAALRRIRAARALFVSRGDDSGTHAKERDLWRRAGLDPHRAGGGWYRETGTGMGATLNIAIAMAAYTLTDRATWAAFASRRDHRILRQGDEGLENLYSIIRVNPARHPHVKAAEAAVLADWLSGPAGQAAIAGYRIAGAQVFFPAN